MSTRTDTEMEVLSSSGCQPHATKCQFCGKGIVVYIHSECPVVRFDAWMKAAACNRCADFKSRMVGLRDHLTKAAFGLAGDRRNAANAGKKLTSDVESAYRTKIHNTLSQVVDCASEYYRIEKVWDDEFINAMMENPTQCNQIVTVYLGNVRRISKELHAA